MKTPVVLTNLEEKTPAEIDFVLFELEARLWAIKRQIAAYRERADEAKSEVMRERFTRDLDDYVKRTADEATQLREWIAPLVAEFTRRGGWTRFTFCLSAGGHYHREADCHTTRGSALTWIADLSGLDDNAVIEKVGYHACSQDECFPTAPLHPAWAISEQRDKEAQRAAREAKYAKGLATREKKIASITKRLNKAKATIDRYAGASVHSQEAVLASHAQHDLEWETRNLGWAQRELDQWIAKKK